MNTKHRWYDVIVAWAGGENIQFNDIRFEQEWSTLEKYNDPFFNDDNFEWRIKPKTVIKKYRMALVSASKFNSVKNVISVDITDISIDDPIEYNVLGFIRWVGEPVEVEIEV